MAQMTASRPSDRELRTFTGLRRLIATLRGPEGCPWDRVQTHESLRPYLVEEAAETIAALDDGDSAKLKEELGDLLFEVLLHVQLAEERGDFKMADVIESVGSKLVRRHPHVFADATADTPDAVVEQWDDLKKKERGTQPALAGIPATLPGLALAQAIQRRAGKAGFAWENEEQVWEALQEELDELREASTPEAKREEAGDALFAMANLVRYFEVDAEDAIRQTARGFVRLFEGVEAMAAERGVDMILTDLESKLRLWEEAKSQRDNPGAILSSPEGGST
jgi:tetrapyrrole methylase family protein / MazG family protein